MFAIKFLLVLCCTGSCYCNIRSNVGIYGGHKVAIEDAPYMASLGLVGLYTRYHQCGGSVIHESFVMTAGHCIKPNRIYDIKVGTDIKDGAIRTTKKNGDIYEIEKFIIHEDYNPVTHNMDLCLVKLTTPIMFGPKVTFIDLAYGDISLSAGTMLNVTGWGSTETERSSKHLLQVSVPVVDHKQCQKKISTRLTSNMICAGVSGKDTCLGDSGGPLTLGNAQYGITSFGRGCGKYPGVYTLMTFPLQNWIKWTVFKNL